MDERGHVLRALTERWQIDLNDAQSVVEIFAKGAVVDHLTKVAVRRGDHPDVDRDHACAADALHLARFEHAQELGLKAEGELADLVEKERATIRYFEAALLTVGGAGERAAFVPKQDAFDEVRRDRAAVLNDERALRALRRTMNRAGDELLASAGFAANEHREVGGGHLLEHRENLSHAHAVPN